MAITIEQKDIEDVFGTVFVSQWSSNAQGNTPPVNAARMTKAINNAYGYVNGRLAGGPYGTPVTANIPASPPSEIVNAMATYAGWWLWRTRGLNMAKDTIKWMADLRAEIDRTLLLIKTGSYPVDCQLNTARRQAPFVCG